MKPNPCYVFVYRDDKNAKLPPKTVCSQVLISPATKERFHKKAKKKTKKTNDNEKYFHML